MIKEKQMGRYITIPGAICKRRRVIIGSKHIISLYQNGKVREGFHIRGQCKRAKIEYEVTCTYLLNVNALNMLKTYA